MVDSVSEQKVSNSLEIGPIVTLEGHLNGVDCVKFNPVKKNQLISGSFDKTFRSWDINTSKCVKEVKAHDAGIWALDFAKDGKNFVTASADKTLKIWDASGYQEISTLKGHSYHVYSVNYSPDNTKLLSSSEDGCIKIWDLKKGQVLKSIEHIGKIATSSMFSQDGRYIFVATSEGELVAFDAVTYNELTRTPHLDNVRAFSIALDFNCTTSFQRSVFVGYEDMKVRRWGFDGSAFTQESELAAHTDQCKHVNLITSLGYFATCGRDGSAKVWDTEGNALLFNLYGATDAATMSAYAEDAARTLAVSSWDQKVRVYQLPSFNF